MNSCRASAACSPHCFRGADLQSAHATGWSALLDLYLCGFWNSWMMPLLHIGYFQGYKPTCVLEWDKCALISADFISLVAVRSSCVKVRLFSFLAIHYALLSFILCHFCVSTNRRVFAGKTSHTEQRNLFQLCEFASVCGNMFHRCKFRHKEH